MCLLTFIPYTATHVPKCSLLTSKAVCPMKDVHLIESYVHLILKQSDFVCCVRLDTWRSTLAKAVFQFSGGSDLWQLDGWEFIDSF